MLNPEAEEFRRSKLPGKYIAKILFRWDDRKFKDEYLKKLEGEREASSSGGRILRDRYCYSMVELLYFTLIFFYFYLFSLI